MKAHNLHSPLLPDYDIFVDPNLYDITDKQYKDFLEIADVIQWGRKNPCLFAEQMLGIELLDYQKYLIENTWKAEQAVWLCSRAAGKTTVGAVYIMLRAWLIPNCQIYICTGVGSQSIETFQKIEKIVKNQIPSFKSLTNIYGNELVKSQAKSDGFVRDPSSFHYRLYNGSSVNTLNGNIGNLRSNYIFIILNDFI